MGGLGKLWKGRFEAGQKLVVRLLRVGPRILSGLWVTWYGTAGVMRATGSWSESAMAEPQANNIPVPKHLDEAREKTLSIAMASGGLI